MCVYKRFLACASKVYMTSFLLSLLLSSYRRSQPLLVQGIHMCDNKACMNNSALLLVQARYTYV